MARSSISSRTEASAAVTTITPQRVVQTHNRDSGNGNVNGNGLDLGNGNGNDHAQDQHVDSDLSLEEIDIENLRLVFGSSSPEDLRRRKAHELRELWLEKTSTATAAQTPNTKKKNLKTARMPRFLLDPKNEDHVAPHAVALQLLLGQRRSKSRRSPDGDGLYRKVASTGSSHGGDSEIGIGIDSHSDGDDDDDWGIEASNNNNNANNKSNTAIATTNSPLPSKGMMWPLLAIATISLACQFVLEVLGGAGAIWGCAELARLRTGGAGDPSWKVSSWAALGVGICCLGRFLLVHFHFYLPSGGATTFTFAETHKLHEMVRRHTTTAGLFVELAHTVARDPVLFLHPTLGPPKLLWCCGYSCVCCGSRWS